MTRFLRHLERKLHTHKFLRKTGDVGEDRERFLLTEINSDAPSKGVRSTLEPSVLC